MRVDVEQDRLRPRARSWLGPALVRCHMVLLEVEVEVKICNGNLIVGKHHVSCLTFLSNGYATVVSS
jgi:hypothetical protein